MSQVVGVRVAGREDLAVGEAIALAVHGREAPEIAWGARGESHWVHVPLENVTRSELWRRFTISLVVSLLWVSIPLAWVFGSRSPAAPPFALFYGGTAAFAFCALARVPGIVLAWAELASVLLSAGALVHLAIAFPSNRELLVRFPRLGRLPYLALAFLLPVALVAFHSNAMVWSIGVRLSAVGFLALWAALVAAAMRAAREAGDKAAGAQARAFLWASALVALVPLPLVAGAGHPALGLALGAVVAPLPVGFAASRYPVHDLGLDARRGLARVLLYSVAAALSAGVYGLVIEASLLAVVGVWSVAFAASGCFDGLRSLALGRLESGLVPEIERLSSRSDAFSREISTLSPEDEVARRLACAVRDGLRTESVSIVRLGVDGALIGSEGASHRAGAVRDALELLDGRSCVLLPAMAPPLHPAADRLLGDGVRLVAALASAGETFAVVFVGAPLSAAPYRGIHAAYLSTLGAHGAVAVRNARVGEALLAAERRAAAGRAALAMAHDVGKELDWIRRLAARLPGRVSDPKRFARDTRTISELAEDLAEQVRARVREAGLGLSSTSHGITLSSVVDRVAAKAGRAHGSGLVVNLDEAARHRRVSGDAEFVIGAVVDNALRATALGTAVHVYVDASDRATRVAVRDHGPGPESAARWLQPGWSGEVAGAGVGLPLAHEMMRGLGGGLRLEAAEDGGTRAVLEFPCEV